MAACPVFKVNAKVGNKCFKIHMCFISSSLPGDYPVDNLILLAAGTTQVNPGCFEIFVSKQIGEQGNIAAFFDKNSWQTGGGMHADVPFPVSCGRRGRWF